MRSQCERVNKGTLRAVAAVALVGSAGIAGAFPIDAGNDDLQLRLDNKISFTSGWRVKGRDSDVAANPAVSASVASDYFADKGDLYTTRFDLYSEFDIKYKTNTGLRLSGAAWYDPKFPDQVRPGPGGVADSTYGPSGNWSSEVKRYYGSSAEMLDAFGFTRFDLGSVPVNVKLGRTSVVWGESMFGGVGGANSIGYAQSPNDGRKSSQNPNASLKETSLPLGQLGLVFNVADNANFSVYRAFEWRADRVPGSGTYMGFGDGVAGAPNLFCAANGAFCYPYGAPVNGKAEDWGLQYKVRPSFIDSSLSFSYREFSEKSPWYAVWNVDDNFPVGSARSVYGTHTKVLGIAFNTTKWDISWAGELNYRKNAALASDFSALAPVAIGGVNGPGGLFSVSPTDGARGDTWHALANMQFFGGKALFWDTFVVAAEVGFNYLQKVTRNPQYYQAVGSSYAPVICNAPAAFGGAVNKKVAGCADRSATSLGIYLDPTIYQVLPSIDLEIPVFFQTGWGNSPLNGGSTDGFNTISAGLKATWNTPYGPQVFSLNYLGFMNRKDANNPNGHSILGGPYYDRDQIQFSYSTSF